MIIVVDTITHELNVRREWLITFFAYLGASVLLAILKGYIEGTHIDFYKNANVLWILLSSSWDFLPWALVTYHCAYKKRGIIWLSLVMLSLPLRELGRIIRGDWNQIVGWDQLGWLVVAAFLVTEVCFWINCLRLRRVNEDRRRGH